jgi:Transposase DDE domain
MPSLKKRLEVRQRISIPPCGGSNPPAPATLDRNPDKMRVRRQTVEYPFGTIKPWMGATHFQMRRLPKVASEMALQMLAYNMKRVMQILGVGGLMAAMRKPSREFAASCSESLRLFLERRGTTPIIPNKSNRKQLFPFGQEASRSRCRWKLGGPLRRNPTYS